MRLGPFFLLTPKRAVAPRRGAFLFAALRRNPSHAGIPMSVSRGYPDVQLTRTMLVQLTRTLLVQLAWTLLVQLTRTLLVQLAWTLLVHLTWISAKGRFAHPQTPGSRHPPSFRKLWRARRWNLKMRTASSAVRALPGFYVTTVHASILARPATAGPQCLPGRRQFTTCDCPPVRREPRLRQPRPPAL